MAANQNKKTRHHLICRSLQEKFNVHDYKNIVSVDSNKHEAFHEFFSEAHHPKAQLKELYCFMSSVLSEKALALFVRLINLTDDEFYSESLLETKTQRRKIKAKTIRLKKLA
jgi:hypothetical protein